MFVLILQVPSFILVGPNIFLNILLSNTESFSIWDTLSVIRSSSLQYVRECMLFRWLTEENQNTSEFGDVGVLYIRGKCVILLFSEPARIVWLVTFYWRNLIAKLVLFLCVGNFSHKNTQTMLLTLTLNIPSLARQRCLSSWGPRRTPRFFCNFSTVWCGRLLKLCFLGFWNYNYVIQALLASNILCLFISTEVSQ